MSLVLTHGDVECHRLSPEHAEAYASMLMREMGLLDAGSKLAEQHFLYKDFLNKANRFLSSQDYAYFGLSVHDQWIGKGTRSPGGMIEDLFIDPDYRGRKYINLIYDACIRDIVDQNVSKTALAKIWENNTGSIQAAERNGLVIVDRQETTSPNDVLIMACDLSGFD